MASNTLKNFSKIIVVNFIVLFILLLVVEIFIHFFLINTDNEKYVKYASLSQLDERGLNPIYSPHRYLGYSLTPNYVKGKNKHNSLGFRGDEIEIPKQADTYRIFCLGGSTTYTTHVEDYQKSYPYFLQENLNKAGLNVEVINAGAGSWTTYESLINFQLRILDLEPDMIIIYHSINDIKNRIVFPFEKYTSDNSGRRAPLIEHNMGVLDWIIEKSNIVRIISIHFRLVRSKQSILTIDPMSESFVFDLFLEQLRSNTYPSGIFAQHSLEEIFETNDPKYFKKNILLMIALAQHHDIDIMMSTFAHSDKITKKHSDIIEIKNALDEQNEVIKQIAYYQQIKCLDFDKVFSSRINLFRDKVHVNERGSKVKASIFSEFIISNYFSTED